MEEIYDLMGRLKGNDSYFYMKGEDPAGSRDRASSGICFHSGGSRTTVDCSDVKSLSYFSSSLHHFLPKERIMVSWGAKDVFSFLRGKTEIPLEFTGSLYDLSLICSYLSIDAEMPKKYRGALDLLKTAVSHPGWPSFARFYSEVYVPLSVEVLPEVENCCLVDNSKRMCVYPYYVLEGQANGRMKALSPTDSHYNPHSMGPEQRASIRPPNYDDCFVSFDYKNMEVEVLRWLSGDDNLGGILDSGEDPYRAIWSKVIGAPAEESQRSICKEVFLPVVFGQGARSLSSRIGVSEKNASRIIDRLVSSFPVAFDWVTSQSPDGDNIATDRFGRRRFFEERNFYKVRNFSVQSPASMICLKKLVSLHRSLSGLARVCFHVHDGYCLVCAKNDVDTVFELGTKLLEQEDPMFPGLKLKTSCRFGNHLEKLKPIKRGIPDEAHT